MYAAKSFEQQSLSFDHAIVKTRVDLIRSDLCNSAPPQWWDGQLREEPPRKQHGQVAQSVEQGIENPRVGSSILSLATIFFY